MNYEIKHKNQAESRRLKVAAMWLVFNKLFKAFNTLSFQFEMSWKRMSLNSLFWVRQCWNTSYWNTGSLKCSRFISPKMTVCLWWIAGQVRLPTKAIHVILFVFTAHHLRMRKTEKTHHFVTEEFIALCFWANCPLSIDDVNGTCCVESHINVKS